MAIRLTRIHQLHCLRGTVTLTLTPKHPLGRSSVIERVRIKLIIEELSMLICSARNPRDTSLCYGYALLRCLKCKRPARSFTVSVSFTDGMRSKLSQHIRELQMLLR